MKENIGMALLRCAIKVVKHDFHLHSNKLIMLIVRIILSEIIKGENMAYTLAPNVTKYWMKVGSV